MTTSKYVWLAVSTVLQLGETFLMSFMFTAQMDFLSLLNLKVVDVDFLAIPRTET